jgi:protein TonB
MGVAIFLSVVAHVVLPIALIILGFVLFTILGINLSDLFPHPQAAKTQDLEFVLVPPNRQAQKPIDAHTPYRADKDMRAGGPHDASKPINLNPHKQPQPSVATAAVAQPTPTQPTPQPPKPQEVKPVPAAETPLAAQTATKPAATDDQSKSNTAQLAAASEEANGGLGNKNDALGVDALQEPDFGPYMSELQRRIKETWHPPRGNESKRVVVAFEISKQGKLIQASVSHSSGEPLADQAALLAIQQTFPFKPLPGEYRDESIDIEFTFDYKVFGDKQHLSQGTQFED